MKHLLNLLFSTLFIIFFSTFTYAQDTLVSEIKIVKTSEGYEITFSKDKKVSNQTIIEILDSFFGDILKEDLATKPKEEIKIYKY